MDLGQRFRQWRRRNFKTHVAVEQPAQEAGPPPPSDEDGDDDRLRRWPWALAAAGLLFGLAYYPIGALIDHQINDEVSYQPAPPPAGGSRAVAATAALITREVDETGWVANTPPVAYNALLKVGGNMMNFQVGQIEAAGEFALAMRRYGGRGRGGSEEDPDLEIAASQLQIDAERWVLRPNFVPQRSSVAEYREARDALLRYNERLVRGETRLELGRDNLLRVLDAVALDLGSDSATLDEAVLYGRRVLVDLRADKVFYRIKGKAYAYLIIMRGLRGDFAAVIDADERAALRYGEVLADLEAAVRLRPAVVMNGATDGALAPNHLAALGFHILRARMRMREITDILRT